MIKDEKGQSLVEMALIVPLLLLLLVGIIDLGRVLYSYTHIQLATQETVRLGGLGGSDSELVTFAKQYVHIGDPAKLQVTITPDDVTRMSGEYMTVTLQYPIELMTPFLSSLLPSPMNIITDSTIRVE
ncbi:pilus assembly protein [Bacillus sp. HMF5848]|uniref:TadE/TadG family type IV pilus assembly protein n=1 Tax=Bacillus sp. HMF5848 TaxID=2495421 RepID=UPI000F77A2E6|nr:TadE/TadG family type IV pilus assembly protein [Bacillus sp. HMF5848]RSK26372.1 pilus assembly protein [Bacillus sp. HMF5848]